jgi:hypothetical protein
VYKDLRYDYPAVYDLWWKPDNKYWNEEMGREMAVLHIGYLLADTRARLPGLPPEFRQHVIAADGNMSLIELPH